jgi:sec-independent protein translocase protein TatA
MPNIGPTELIILLVIVLVIFGPKRLPGLGKQLGSGMRDFKEAVTSKHDSDDDDEAERPALTQATAAEPTATTPTDAPASVAVPAPAERPGQDA